MISPRALAALWAGKATAGLSRGLRQGGGTTLPGDVARFLDPAILARLSSGLADGAIVVTGTNGKTTTAALMRHILERTGRPVVSNRAGANLIFGVTAAVLDSAGWTGRTRAQAGLFEIDEASLPQVVAEVRPRVVVVLNLFRDQLDRYGELEHTAAVIGRALRELPSTSRAVLNADDPMVAALGQELGTRTCYFGLDEPAAARPALPHAADAKFCPRCGTALAFSRVYLGHAGLYRCPRGDFERPPPGLRGRALRMVGMERLELGIGNGSPLDTAVPLAGVYNAYNVLAAVAGVEAFGVPLAQAGAALQDFRPAFGRMERVELEGRVVYVLLAKNPTGFNEVLRTAIGVGLGRHFLIAINDRVADGQDVSWLWDVDFELLPPAATRIVVAGDRAQDLAVRLKYAQVPAQAVAVIPGGRVHWARAWDEAVAATPTGEALFVLPTYTAMLELRRVLVDRRVVRPYWL